MNKAIIIGGAALAALLPAGLGLAANPSLSERVPLKPASVTSVSVGTGAEDSRTPRPTATPSDSPVSTSTGAPSPDDHGGDRPRGVSDDPAGDDHGGDRKNGEDTSTRGGSGSGSGSDSGSGSGSGSGSSGGHGSDD